MRFIWLLLSHSTSFSKWTLPITFFCDVRLIRDWNETVYENWLTKYSLGITGSGRLRLGKRYKYLDCPITFFKFTPFSVSPGGRFGGAKLWPTFTIIEAILEIIKYIALLTSENCEDDICVFNNEILILVTTVMSCPLSDFWTEGLNSSKPKLLLFYWLDTH